MAKKDNRVKYQSDAERPVTISLRIPPELYDRLERYAREHRQPVSELVRDGIEMRLEVEADPRSRRAGSTTDETEFQIDGASILRDMQATLARHDTQMHALMQAIERQTTPAGNGMSEDASYHVIRSNTAREPEGQATVFQAAQNPALAEDPSGDSADVPPYDASKYHLGKLCPSQDAWGETGQSLRNADGQCLACRARGKREKRAQQRQAAAR